MIATGDCGGTIGRHTRTNNHHLQLKSEPERKAGAAMVQNDASPKEHETSGSLSASSQAIATHPGLLEPKLGSITQQSTNPSTMIFSDFYRSPRSPLSKLRTNHAQLPAHLLISTPEWVSDEYTDLLSRDKAKQKDAVRRYLSDKVRNDWTFTWPPAMTGKKSASATSQQLTTVEIANSDATAKLDGTNQTSPLRGDGYQREEDTELDKTESDTDEGDIDDDDAESVYSVVSEDAAHFRPRTEWTSDLSDVDDDEVSTKCSPFRFDNPDAVQSTVQEITEARKAGRRRALREEMSWNDGLACFEARRNAWTGAKTVRLRSKPVVTPPASPRSPRRFFFRRSMSGSPPGGPTGPNFATVSHHGDSTAAISDTSSVSKGSTKDLKKHSSVDSSASESSHGQLYPVETLLPIGQPILPPSNPLRASISPTVYLSLFDKVILHNLQPACPVNLSDMLCSCVAGWKRDGEWPPRPSAPEPMAAARRKKRATSSTNEQADNVTRRMSFGLLGRDNHDESGTGKAIRRGLQRALGIGAVGVMNG